MWKFFWLFCVLLHEVSMKKLKKHIVLERLEPINFNEKYVIFDEHVKKIDRKQFFFNITLTILQDVDFEITMVMKLYKLSNGEYKETAYSMRDSLCHYLEYQKMLIPDKEGLLKNFIHNCPLKKGVYYVRNVNSDAISAPWVPLWEMKLYMEGFNDVKGQMYNQTLYFSVVEEYV